VSQVINQIIATQIDSSNTSTFLTVFTAQTARKSAIRELTAFISLPSINDAPVYSADPSLSKEAREALFWASAQNAQSKILRISYVSPAATVTVIADFWIFNRSPYYTEDILGRMTGLGSLYMPAGSSVRLQVFNKNSGLLTGSDTIRIFGQVDEY